MRTIVPFAASTALLFTADNDPHPGRLTRKLKDKPYIRHLKTFVISHISTGVVGR